MKVGTATRRSGFFFFAMAASFFCVDMLRTVFFETIAVSALRGNSVKKSFTDSLEYVSQLTGIGAEELAAFFPAEYTFNGEVVAFGKYHTFTVTKSRFEIFPIVS